MFNLWAVHKTASTTIQKSPNLRRTFSQDISYHRTANIDPRGRCTAQKLKRYCDIQMFNLSCHFQTHLHLASIPMRNFYFTSEKIVYLKDLKAIKVIQKKIGYFEQSCLGLHMISSVKSQKQSNILGFRPPNDLNSSKFIIWDFQ